MDHKESSGFHSLLGQTESLIIHRAFAQYHTDSPSLFIVIILLITVISCAR